VSEAKAMAAKHTHQDYALPKKFEPGKNFYIVGALLTVLGLIAFLIGLLGGMEHRAWNGYLIGWWATLSLCLCGPFYIATQYLSGAGWGTSIRRIPEAMGYFLVPAFVLGLILLAGADTLFHWMDPHAAEDPVLAKKMDFLNFTGMAATTVLTFVVWIGLFWAIRRNSVKQDETGDPMLTERNKILSALFMVAFALGFSFITWYWIMSLEPHWFSTMFQVYAFAVLFQAGLAFITLLVIHFRDNDYFGEFVQTRQVHLMGQFVFAFTVFYAYIAFSQFMLIWYANIPEEVSWFIHRIENAGGWGWFIAMFASKFIIPFLVLLPQNNKKNKYDILRFTCYGLLATLPFEIWWWVSFVPVHGEVHVYVPWLELLIVSGFVGIFMISVGRGLASANIMPIKDPFLAESLPHHMHPELPSEDLVRLPQGDERYQEREP
jgi:hypothetical protein